MNCPGTALGAEVDFDGCSDAQNNGGDGSGGDGSGGGSGGTADADNDGVIDDDDFCPDTPMGESVDAFGCSDAQNGGGGGDGETAAMATAAVAVETAAEVAMVVETTAAEITAAADLVDLTIFVFHQEQI